MKLLVAPHSPFEGIGKACAAAGRSQTRMTDLSLDEIWRNVVLLYMADPAVTNCVNAAMPDFQAVA